MAKSAKTNAMNLEKNNEVKLIEENFNKILVTGGAGFIGSHLVDHLMKNGKEVVVIDNLSNGSENNITRWLENKNFKFIYGDLTKQKDVEIAMKDCEIVFHLSANPDVRKSVSNSKDNYEQNVTSTFNVVEAMKNSRCKKIIFTSTSAIYGEPSIIPTSENYGPLIPISPYAGSKLASESLISGYSNTFGFKSVIIRLANVIGSRSNHGVIYDFVQKLKKNSKSLEVLGDGTQNKSYLHISDCISALLTTLKDMEQAVQTYNVGSTDRVTVIKIAETIIESMNLPNTKIKLREGANGGRGWPGDVKEMLLDISKIKKKGWTPKLSSNEAVLRTVKSFLN